MKIGPWAATLPILLIGIALLIGAWFLNESKRSLREEGVAVTAKVVDFRRGNDAGLAPIFEFSWEGVTRRYESPIFSSSSTPEFKFGDVVTLLVDPKDPDRVLVDNFFGRWFIVGLLCVGGLLATLVGAITTYVFRDMDFPEA